MLPHGVRVVARLPVFPPHLREKFIFNDPGRDRISAAADHCAVLIQCKVSDLSAVFKALPLPDLLKMFFGKFVASRLQPVSVTLLSVEVVQLLLQETVSETLKNTKSHPSIYSDVFK